jgi:TetR/AcrR family transcriptional repressor of uid operon
LPKVTPEHMEARKNAVLDAALTCFTRKGFHRTTMQDICRECGLSPGAIYRYFRSKRALIEGVHERSTAQDAALIAAVGGSAPNIVAALETLGRHFFAQLLEPDIGEQERLHAEIHAETLRDDELRAAHREQLQTLRTVLADLLRRSGEDTSLPIAHVEPTALANLLIAVLRGLGYTRAVDSEGVDTEQILRLLYRLLTGRDRDETSKGKREAAPGGASTSRRPAVASRKG